MTDAVKRALRTFVQAFLGVLLSSGILSLMNTEGVVDWAGVKKVGISALGAGIAAVVSYLQNVLEDEQVIPTLFDKQ
jgi:hypothetical protein